MILVNLLLAFTWAALKGEINVINLATGFALGYVVIGFLAACGVYRAKDYAQRFVRVIELVIVFLWELVHASLIIAWDVVTPGQNARPGIIALPLEAETDAEITFLACIITLTPGTCAFEVSEDRTVLYIHDMYLPEDIDAEKRTIKETFERRLLEVMR